MCPSLLDVNFRHNFRTLLFYLTFGCHFMTSHLEVTFWTAMLGKTVFLSRVKLRLLPGSRMARHTDIATYGLNQPWVRFVKIHKKAPIKKFVEIQRRKKTINFGGNLTYRIRSLTRSFYFTLFQMPWGRGYPERYGHKNGWMKEWTGNPGKI